jgi:hypothetical protein
MKGKLTKNMNLADHRAPAEDLQGLMDIPSDEVLFARASQQMSGYIDSWLENRLKPADLLALRSSFREQPEDTSHSSNAMDRVFVIFDELIFEQARTLGMRVFMIRNEKEQQQQCDCDFHFLRLQAIKRFQ